jgi:hypothetical protein
MLNKLVATKIMRKSALHPNGRAENTRKYAEIGVLYAVELCKYLEI